MYSRYSTSVYQPGLFYLGCFFQHPKGHRAAGLRQGRSISSRQGTGTPGMLTSLGTQPVMFSAQAHAGWGTVCNPPLSVSHLLASHTYFLPPSLTFPSPSPWSPSPLFQFSLPLFRDRQGQMPRCRSVAICLPCVLEASVGLGPLPSELQSFTCLQMTASVPISWPGFVDASFHSKETWAKNGLSDTLKILQLSMA